MLASGAMELVVPMQVLIDAPSVARSPGNRHASLILSNKPRGIQMRALNRPMYRRNDGCH
jgi:hypothetical protein